MTTTNLQTAQEKSGTLQYRAICQHIRCAREKIRLFDGASAYKRDDNIRWNMDVCSAAIENEIQGQHPVDFNREFIDSTGFDQGDLLSFRQGRDGVWRRKERSAWQGSRHGRR